MSKVSYWLVSINTVAIENYVFTVRSYFRESTGQSAGDILVSLLQSNSRTVARSTR